MSTIAIVTDPVQSAKSAGLRYVYDNGRGIQRRKFRGAFRYIGVDGAPVRDPEVLKRIKSLVIPPAWTDVWICPTANGHLQATGRDAKGRKQSRYHPKWREVRDEAKYERMLLFGAALPRIRQRVEHDLRLPGLPREKVLATIVRLLETTSIRVGNTEYAKENKSYGLTTMRRRHVRVEGSKVRFDFRGKSGVRHTIDIEDKRLAKIVAQCNDIPGYELFTYLDHDGACHRVDAADVNAYLAEITAGHSEEHFTAKDFRTWAGTVLAAKMLREFAQFQNEREAKKNVVRAIQSVAQHLGNTPSVCRKCYVHPAVVDSYLSGGLVEMVAECGDVETTEVANALLREEFALMRLLEGRLEAAAD
jgi:DNA topoisomerase-1